ncbi:Mast Cell-Expressed Membrane Protein 1 [Manis pentadactyla]|nr:Mast Cell-Expressed Membrane Protein 1 [Manis pentadactyla]
METSAYRCSMEDGAWYFDSNGDIKVIQVMKKVDISEGLVLSQSCAPGGLRTLGSGRNARGGTESVPSSSTVPSSAPSQPIWLARSHLNTQGIREAQFLICSSGPSVPP